MSSIKANGEETTTQAFTAMSEPRPQDPYGQSKLEAEQAIAAIAESGPTEFTAIRTPLIYGPRVGGNFRRLLTLVDRQLPLPLGSVHNRRTMVSVWNLSDLIAHLLATPGPPNQIVLAGDAESLSTPDIIRAIGQGLGKPARILWFPSILLKVMGRVLRRRAEVDRLINSLEVQVGSTAPNFSWSPPISARDGISTTAMEWLKSARN